VSGRPGDSPDDEGWTPTPEEARLIASHILHQFYSDPENYPWWEDLPALTKEGLDLVEDQLPALCPPFDERGEALYRRATEA